MSESHVWYDRYAEKNAAPEVEKQSNTIQDLALAVKAPVFNI